MKKKMAEVQEEHERLEQIQKQIEESMGTVGSPAEGLYTKCGVRT